MTDKPDINAFVNKTHVPAKPFTMADMRVVGERIGHGEPANIVKFEDIMKMLDDIVGSVR